MQNYLSLRVFTNKACFEVMEILLLSVGKSSANWVKEAFELYASRVSHYIKFSSLALPDVKSGSNINRDKIKEDEGVLILSKLASHDHVVLLDENGIERTSIDFAEWLSKVFCSSKKRLVFIIGGPFGFSQKVYDRADAKISLSKMTFTHEMARVIFVEQLYRAMTIIRGESYHHV